MNNLEILLQRCGYVKHIQKDESLFLKTMGFSVVLARFTENELELTQVAFGNNDIYVWKRGASVIDTVVDVCTLEHTVCRGQEFPFNNNIEELIPNLSVVDLLSKKLGL